MRFKNILFPVDFSRRAHGAATLIRALAERFGASLTLLHAGDTPTMWYGMESPITPEIEWPQIEREARKRLEEFALSEFPGAAVKTLVRRGDPASTIVDFAERESVDLIAMPTHGRGIFRAALLGSVTAKVLHDAHCAVWTDAHAAEADASRQNGWRSILCAIDASAASKPLILTAAELRDQFGAVVRLVHAVPGADLNQEQYNDIEFQRFLEDTARKSIAALQCEAGTNFEVCLGAGSPARVVADAAEHHKADLVVIGRGHLRGIAGRLRTNAYGIIRETPCPVLSV